VKEPGIYRTISRWGIQEKITTT